MNKRYSTTVAALAAVTIMATGTIAPLLGQTLQTANAQLSGYTKIVRDDPAGNAVGWNPDGLKRSFNIIDEEVTLNDTILINTHHVQNFTVCSVDARYQFGFEVNCIETTNGYAPPTPPQMPVLEGGPANDTILYYTVITANVVPVTAPPADLLEQAQNATVERREGAEEGEEAAE
jgi:hypothetical protein